MIVSEEWWAVRHTGGCSGKLHGFTLKPNKVMAQIALKRRRGGLRSHQAVSTQVITDCDPACRVVRIRVEVVEVEEGV